MKLQKECCSIAGQRPEASFTFPEQNCSSLADEGFFSTMLPMKLEVLYHDNHLLAVNKPSGLLTQPSGTDKDNLEDRSKGWIKETKNKPGNVFLHAVHRLDKDVSGIVLFAGTDKALSRLNADMRAHKFTKIYHAVVSGIPPQAEGSLRHFLTHDDYHAKIAREGDPEAKECLLDYKVLSIPRRTDDSMGRATPPGSSELGRTAEPLPCNGSLGEFALPMHDDALGESAQPKISLLEIQLHTGRYHQIRAQLAAIGCPILGDEKYGSTVKLPGGAIALHHARLTVIHPVTKEEIVIEAPHPGHWPGVSWRKRLPSSS
jgi:23S rRNA pseudouridine1911/1915/1917 synthase